MSSKYEGVFILYYQRSAHHCHPKSSAAMMTNPMTKPEKMRMATISMKITTLTVKKQPQVARQGTVAGLVVKLG